VTPFHFTFALILFRCTNQNLPFLLSPAGEGMKQRKGPGRTTDRILPLKTNLPLNNMKLFKNLAFAALMGVQTVSAGTFGASATPAFACPAKLPSVEVMQGFPDVENINVAEYCSGKNVIIVGLPGAFTPT
jgi:hypothetical protein